MWHEQLVDEIKFYTNIPTTKWVHPTVKLFKYYQWRVQTLLEANNRLLERARAAEANLKIATYIISTYEEQYGA